MNSFLPVFSWGIVDCGCSIDPDNKSLTSTAMHKTTALTAVIPCIVGPNMLLIKMNLDCLVPLKRDFHHALKPTESP